MNKQETKKAILEILKSRIRNRKDLMMAKRRMAVKYSIPIFSNAEIFKEYRELVKTGKVKRSPVLDQVLRKRAVRTLSGIAPVAVLTRHFPCPGKCAFCPTEKDVPQSYLSNEPAVMRAIRCNYDPFIQVQDRLRALVANGHEPTKMEVIVIGGTWSAHPRKYKYWYILNCFAAANQFSRKSIKSPAYRTGRKVTRLSDGQESRGYSINLKIDELKKLLLEEQKKNEKAKYNIIGLTLETRPDYINEKELIQMRELGCTRVEIGVQAIDDKILKLNKRGHGVEKIADSTEMLRSFGFKITYHIMPGLPGATPALDAKMFKQLFCDPRFQPDQIKFYPTVVTKGSLMYRWWKQGKYKPYTDKQLQKLIIDCKTVVPSYVRIIRLIRDIPGESIEAGNKITNLRQVMQDRGVKCNCIRCRESRESQVANHKLQIINYKVTGGEEFFISFENKKKNILYAFCRLFVPDSKTQALHQLTSGGSIVRELHVYGELVSIGTSTGSAQAKKEKKVQHIGLGKLLIKKAEEISLDHGLGKISIISGVGVRGYYRKLGYRLNNTYMVKNIKE